MFPGLYLGLFNLVAYVVVVALVLVELLLQLHKLLLIDWLSFGQSRHVEFFFCLVLTPLCFQSHQVGLLSFELLLSFLALFIHFLYLVFELFDL